MGNGCSIAISSLARVYSDSMRSYLLISGDCSQLYYGIAKVVL